MLVFFTLGTMLVILYGIDLYTYLNYWYLFLTGLVAVVYCWYCTINVTETNCSAYLEQLCILVSRHERCRVLLWLTGSSGAVPSCFTLYSKLVLRKYRTYNRKTPPYH